MLEWALGTDEYGPRSHDEHRSGVSSRGGTRDRRTPVGRHRRDGRDG